MANSRNAPEPSPDELFRQDLRSLRAFVIQLRELLEAVVEDGRHIPRDQLDEVRDAWPLAARDLNSLVDALTPEGASNHRESLALHGLTGESLRMKDGAWRMRLFNFGRRMNRRWLRSVLRWGDTLLSSLVDAMTLGAAGKEFKECIENFLTEADEDRVPERKTPRRRKRR